MNTLKTNTAGDYLAFDSATVSRADIESTLKQLSAHADAGEAARFYLEHGPGKWDMHLPHLVRQLKAGRRDLAWAAVAMLDQGIVAKDANAYHKAKAAGNAPTFASTPATPAVSSTVKPSGGTLTTAGGTMPSTRAERDKVFFGADFKSATTQWNEEIDARVAKGMTRQAACASLVHDNPDLQREYIAEGNERQPQRQAKPTAMGTGTATSRWDAAIAAAKVRGDRNAFASVDRDHPGLREEMIAEANAGRLNSAACSR